MRGSRDIVGVIIGTLGSHGELVQDVAGCHEHGNHIGLHEAQAGNHFKQLLIITSLKVSYDGSGAGHVRVTGLAGDDPVKELLLTSGDHGVAGLTGDVHRTGGGESRGC